MRVTPPSFLMSPVRRRSNIDNASAHIYSSAHRLLDIADFYPNCTASKVAWFFVSVLQCAPDIVAILVWLTTRNGALPQGSPSSPILAYFAYEEMWSEIASITSKSGNILTVYVDDVTVSGERVLGSTIWQVKSVLRKHGHKAKDSKEEARLQRPVVVTGVVLNDCKLLLPNSQHKRRHELRKQLEGMPLGPERQRLEATLAGHDETARQIGLKSEQF